MTGTRILAPIFKITTGNKHQFIENNVNNFRRTSASDPESIGIYSSCCPPNTL